MWRHLEISSVLLFNKVSGLTQMMGPKGHTTSNQRRIDGDTTWICRRENGTLTGWQVEP